MKTMTATSVRNDFLRILKTCNKFNETITITNKRSGNAVLMSEEEYNGWLATMELCNVLGMKEKIIKGMKSPVDECEDFEL